MEKRKKIYDHEALWIKNTDSICENCYFYQEFGEQTGDSPSTILKFMDCEHSVMDERKYDKENCEEAILDFIESELEE